MDFDEYAERYQELLDKQHKLFANAHYFSKHKATILKAKILKNPRNLLEYGCGIGRNFPSLQGCFPETKFYGCDVSTQSLGAAASRNPEVTFFNNLEGGNTEEFDLILVANVLHHIEPTLRASVFQDLKKKLAPKGEIFIFEHNPYNPVTRHLVKHCEFDEDAVLLKPKEMTALVIESGLILHQLSYTLFIPAFLKALHFLEAYLGYIPLGGQYYAHASKEA